MARGERTKKRIVIPNDDWRSTWEKRHPTRATPLGPQKMEGRVIDAETDSSGGFRFEIERGGHVYWALVPNPQPKWSINADDCLYEITGELWQAETGHYFFDVESWRRLED